MQAVHTLGCVWPEPAQPMGPWGAPSSCFRGRENGLLLSSYYVLGGQALPGLMAYQIRPAPWALCRPQGVGPSVGPSFIQHTLIQYLLRASKLHWALGIQRSETLGIESRILCVAFKLHRNDAPLHPISGSSSPQILAYSLAGCIRILAGQEGLRSLFSRKSSPYVSDLAGSDKQKTLLVKLFERFHEILKILF